MQQVRRDVHGGNRPKRLLEGWRAVVCALRSRGASTRHVSRVGQRGTEEYVALRGGASRCRAGDAWRGIYADAAEPQAS